MKLKGKVALVTGNSQGIGQASAIRPAQEGASIAINYRSHPEGAQESLDKVHAAGGKCYMAQSEIGTTIQADIGKSEARLALCSPIATFGYVPLGESG